MTFDTLTTATRPLLISDDGLAWHVPDTAPFALAGLAWYAEDRRYRRLPLHPPKPLPDAVNALADNPAGAQVRFRTDSPRLSVRVRLSAPGGMVHMPATGQCGFDCYLGAPGRMRYCGTTKYDHTQASYTCQLFALPAGQMRDVTLFFPLYQGVDEVLVGLEQGARVLPPAPFARPEPVVIYGTSITQGGCACRPGMAYTNILSRRLNLEVINLGFSGNGKGEPEVAEAIAQIPHPACFVLDHEANCDLERMKATYRNFIDILRAAHPVVPILAVSRIIFASEYHNEAVTADRLARRDFQRGVVEELQRQGDRHITFLDGGTLLGEDADECTVDSVHPTDLGFLRMADSFEPVLRGILGLG